MADIESIRTTLRGHGQEHLLQFADELPAAQRDTLLDQIASIDFGQFDRWVAEYVKGKPVFQAPSDIQPPTIFPAKPAEPAAQKLFESARAEGERLLAAGKVAAFVVAGGQGTRLGYEGPKGCLEATPVAHKPLFQVFAEQVLAASRRTGGTVPWYVMTSPANDVATRAFFRQNKFFGLEAKNVFFFVQGAMPAIGLDGKILLADKGSLALSPNGHGGSLLAMRTSGALDDMATRGVELISYFQVDNPLVRCLDPLFLGLHSLEGAEMSAKCLPKRDPMERLGNFCVVDGRVTVIEYSDMPESLATATAPDGRLRFSAGSIAIHVLSRSFVERLTAGGPCRLPLHRAEKKVPHIDASGRPVKPEKPNAVKLEMFVFDAMPVAKKTVILETQRREEFSPVKNASGEDSLATSLHDQVRRSAAWLEAAGVKVPRDADGQVAAALEISPLCADSLEALRGKVDPAIEIAAGQSVYFGDRGQVGGAR
jgi:UDP-N-acetylglucosamine/UDP-N-acetylgalactosamine diphosphorylase